MAETEPKHPETPPDAERLDRRDAREDRDLGFGAVVATSSRRRLLNRDGSFNVQRHGLGWRSTLSLYPLLEVTRNWGPGGRTEVPSQRRLRSKASSEPDLPDREAAARATRTRP